MSLTDRLRKIEARLTALEQAQGEQVELVAQLADAIDPEPESEPARTLDGEGAGGERDQSQEL